MNEREGRPAADRTAGASTGVHRQDIGPADITAEAERHVLAAVLATGGACLDDLTLTGADFREPRVGDLYDDMAGMRAEGVPVEALTVSDRHPEQSAFVFSLTSLPAAPGSAAYYASIVRREGMRRRLTAVGLNLAGHDPALDADGLADAARATIERALSGGADRAPTRGGERRTARLTPASTIRTERQSWLWADRIPASTITVLAGRGGEGKSTFAFHLAAQLTRGTLDGDRHGTPCGVAIWSGEDRWETVIIPRLIAAGADLDRVHQLAITSKTDAETREVTPNLPADLPLIREAVERAGVGLVIIDPIASTMTGDQSKQEDVRRTLDGLATIAADTGCVFALIRHFAKGGGNAGDKVTGSHAFRDAVRSLFLFATDDETGRRVVTQEKGNYSEHGGGSLAFELESVPVLCNDGHTADAARVVMLGDSDVTVNDIINRAPGGSDGADDRNAAQQFVLHHLGDRDGGEAPAAEVLKAGRAAGFNETELKHARNRCRSPRIESRKATFGGGWVWAIEDRGVEGATKVPKVPASECLAPSAPSVAPSRAEPLSAPHPACRVCGQELHYGPSIVMGVCGVRDDAHEHARAQRTPDMEATS